MRYGLCTLVTAAALMAVAPQLGNAQEAVTGAAGGAAAGAVVGGPVGAVVGGVIGGSVGAAAEDQRRREGVIVEERGVRETTCVDDGVTQRCREIRR